jgi:DNA-binding NarL/FixJ family response regulator
LLVQGRTNHQIAEALFIPPKTARNQVSSILTKPGLTRADLIAAAR